ncbi:MAG TPA: carboxypeptidase-like regulatory domain-containing protein [Abditibacteriaceae bacterium]|jgi:hypothetical protein
MKRFLLFLSLILAFPLWAATGNVKGRVVNKTTGKAVSGASISLIRIGPDRQDRTVATTKSAANGAFALGPFQAGNDEIFMAQMRWQGRKFEQVAFDGTGRLKEIAGMEVDPNKIELAVYDKSSKMPSFQFVVHHIAIERVERTLKCTERIVAQHESNWVYDGSAGTPKIKLFVPPGAKDLALDPKITNGTLEKQGNDHFFVFKDKTMLPAGMQRPAAILMNYVLDWPASVPWNRKLDISHPVYYPTSFFFVARPPEAKDLKVVSPRLGADETTSIPNAEQQTVQKIVNSIGGTMGGANEGPALKPGETIAITLQQPVNPLVWAFVMFVGALIVIVPLVLRNSGGRKGETTYEAGDEDEEIPSNLQEPTYRADVLGATFGALDGDNKGAGKKAQELIFAIAQLDEDFAGGQMDAQTYQSRRALWKKELVATLNDNDHEPKTDKVVTGRSTTGKAARNKK